MSVELRPLGEVCKTTSGGTPSRSKPHYFEGVIPWVKSGELPDGIVVENGEYISDEAISNSSAKLLPAGTLLVALYGATVGKLGILSRPAATNQAVCAIFPSDAIDTKFLFWYLLAKRPWLIGQAAGGAQPNISQGVVRSLMVPVMPLAAQHEIVAEIEKQFSRLDEAVANLQRVKANLKRYKASVLKDAVEGRLVPLEAELARREGRSFETGEQLLERILETRRNQWSGRGKYKEPNVQDTADLFVLPDGWAAASVAQLTSLVEYGSSAKTDEDPTGVPVLRMGNIVNGEFVFDNLKYLPTDHDEFPKLFVEPGDLLFNRTNSPELVGKTAVFKGAAQPFSYASYLIRLRVVDGCAPDFLAAFINSSHGREWVKRVVTQQVGQANVNGTKLQALVVPLPPLAEQARIVAEADRRMSLVRGVEADVDANLKRATILRQTILHSSFSPVEKN